MKKKSVESMMIELETEIRLQSWTFELIGEMMEQHVFEALERLLKTIDRKGYHPDYPVDLEALEGFVRDRDAFRFCDSVLHFVARHTPLGDNPVLGLVPQKQMPHHGYEERLELAGKILFYWHRTEWAAKDNEHRRVVQSWLNELGIPNTWP